MNGLIYSLHTPPVIKRNYGAVAISTLYNSLLHSYQSFPGDTIKAQELKQSHLITHSEYYTAALLQLTLNNTALHSQLFSVTG
jgi:hypothetical protein